MENPFANFPVYLLPRDIMDVTQYKHTHVYELIKQLEAEIAGAVVRGRRGFDHDGYLLRKTLMR